MAEIILFLVSQGAFAYLWFVWRTDQQETVRRVLTMLEEREAQWQLERADLLNRIQASSFSEYRNLTNDKSPPRSANPLRRAFADPDLVPEP